MSAEPGPPAGSGLQLRLRMSDAQARASAPPTAPPPGEEGSGFQAASCSLFLDAVAGSKVTQGAPAPGAQPPSPVGAWAACGGLNTAKCDKDEACFSCRSSGGQSYTCDRQSQWYWQCTPDTPGPRMPPPLPPAPAGPGVQDWTAVTMSSDGTKLAALVGHYRGDVADGAEIWMSADAGETLRSPGGLRRSSPRASQPPPRRGRPEP